MLVTSLHPSRELVSAGSLPACVRPATAGARLPSSSADRFRVEELLLETGAVLLRGFEVQGVDGFRAFARSFGHELIDYRYASTPRTALGSGVYTSTEYPAHQSIPLHNEQSYTRNWPLKLWFYCELASLSGGETPLADSRAIFARMPLAIRERFARGLVYVRNYGGGLDLSWSEVFGTEDRAEVERVCRQRDIAYEWRDDGELRTRERVQGVARHPHSGEWVWFNQAHLFHVSNLQPEERESLLELCTLEDLPRNVYYADGSAIEDSVLDEVRAVMREQQLSFPWQQGDVLMIDNMLVAHAREPFVGPRRVVVAMAEPWPA